LLSGKLYEPVAKSQLKKMTKLWQQEVRKAEEKAKRDAEAEEATRKKAEEAKKITIAQDPALPAAERTKISHAETLRGKRVKVTFPKILVYF
jgi:asparaginyl-tRNA synthetase